jgi:Flp pilus assembly protein TadD
MPVWINEDFGFITGSMLAYAALAYDRLRSTLPGAELQAEASRVDVATARVLARYKKSPWLHLWRAEALSELGRADEAMVEARTARARFRQHELGESEVDRVEAYVLVRAGKYAHAAAPAARATEALPMHADCWTTLGIVELRAGNNARATECFDKAIELDRRQPTALYERALLRLRGGDQTGALDDLKSAAELAPEDPSIREALQQLLQIVDDPSGE